MTHQGSRAGAPNVEADDTFTVEITFEDGTVERHSRMFNHTFQNIPKLVKYGSVGDLADFDVTDPTINGTPQNPIPLDESQNLLLEVNPPVDETGAHLTGLTYSFTIFYGTNTGGQIQQLEVEYDATWGSSLDFFSEGQYVVMDQTLRLSLGNTYPFTVPEELFKNEVTLTDATTATVDRYKIDINAEHTAARAAVMLTFRKQ